MLDVYITGLGKFLPGNPVSNAEIEDVIGCLGPRSSTLGKATLRKNGIRQRYYSCTPGGGFTHTNAAMAAQAVTNAAAHACRDAANIELLATSTTQGDYLVPGFASSVHAELGIPPVEVASFQSVCASSLMAVKYAWLNVKSGLVKLATASGSEFSSRWFRPGFYQPIYDSDKAPDPELEFLRWTLSDGAGALVLEAEPKAGERCLRIDWIRQKSFADRFPNCMYAGVANNADPDALPWSLYDSPQAAYEAGALTLKQDFDLLYELFPTWIGYYLELVDEGAIKPGAVDWFLPHYSAESLREEMTALLLKTGAMIPEDRWFNNLAHCGNTGSASIFIMLEELVARHELQPDQKILCFVPESGRAVCAFMQLTVI